MTLSINFTDLNTNTDSVKTFTASNKFMIANKVSKFLKGYVYVNGWKAETNDWNAGNNGRNSDVYLQEFLQN
jgi:hypothetical protein